LTAQDRAILVSEDGTMDAGSNGGGGWAGAAQDAGAQAQQAPPQPIQNQPAPAAAVTPQPGVTAGQTATGTPAAQPAAKPAAVTTVPTPPAEAAPVKHGGFRGFMDKVADTLAGTDTSKVRTDKDGNLYIQHGTMSRGQQWLKIAAEALAGAGAGLAAGKGAGNMGKAAEAGIQTGLQFKQAQTQEEKRQQEEVANSQALQHQNAAFALEMTRKQVEGQEHDIEFSENREDWLIKNHGVMVGHANTLPEAAALIRETPGFHDAMNGQALMVPVAQFGPDGKAAGFTVYRMPAGYGEEMAPAGTEIPFFNPVSGEIETQKTTAPMKKADINNAYTAAGNARHKWQIDEQDLATKKAQEKEAEANAGKVPSEIAKNNAEAAAQWAEKKLKDKQAEALTPGAWKEFAKPGAEQNSLIDLIGRGQLANPYVLGRLLMKNPQIGEQVAEQYPDFDISRVSAYTEAYKEFISTKINQAGGALNAGDTALKHLANLAKLNTVKSHIYGTAGYNAYQNQLDTLGPELAKFYGDTTIPAIAALKKTLGAILPSNRQAAIDTQARSMGKKIDSYAQQWKNAAPSDVYEAQMPGISPEGVAALKSLDPDYDHSLFAEVQALKTKYAAGAAPVRVQPGEPTALAADGKTTLVVRNGAWVSAQP
jgi:hypothetical protein